MKNSQFHTVSFELASPDGFLKKKLSDVFQIDMFTYGLIAYQSCFSYCSFCSKKFQNLSKIDDYSLKFIGPNSLILRKKCSERI